MKLSPAQKKIYDYLKEHGGATYRELNDNLYMRKSDMRISEINHAYREKHGEDLIVTLRKKKNGEHVKGLKKRLTRTITKVNIETIDGIPTAVPYQVTESI